MGDSTGDSSFLDKAARSASSSVASRHGSEISLGVLGGVVRSLHAHLPQYLQRHMQAHELVDQRLEGLRHRNSLLRLRARLQELLICDSVTSWSTRPSTLEVAGSFEWPEIAQNSTRSDSQGRWNLRSPGRRPGMPPSVAPCVSDTFGESLSSIQYPPRPQAQASWGLPQVPST